MRRLRAKSDDSSSTQADRFSGSPVMHLRLNIRPVDSYISAQESPAGDRLGEGYPQNYCEQELCVAIHVPTYSRGTNRTLPENSHP